MPLFEFLRVPPRPPTRALPHGALHDPSYTNQDTRTNRDVCV